MNAMVDQSADEPAAPEVATIPATLRVGAQGRWFALGELRVDLTRRKPVARVLWALVVSAQRSPGAGLATNELIAAGWPGERLVRNAGRIRLRVAIATLRTMGLVSRLVTTPVGYMIDGPLSIERIESEPSASELEPPHAAAS
jgi:hypothetical protein